MSMEITVAEVMKVVENGFRLKGEGKNEMPAKIGIHPRHDCFIHAMPCWMGGDVDAAGIKWVSGYPPNQAKGLPYITGVLCLNDSETGIPKAIMDANWITAWRTGAASGVCARYMAQPGSETVAVIGLGVQGRTNLMALNEALPELKHVRVFDAFDEQVKKYVTEMSSLLPHLSFENPKNIQETVRGADVVVTCTPILAEPNRFIRREWLKENALALSVDYDSAFD
ncbi:MAG: ornithine cyclodeaminase family protein, partial [Synergistales bacterium]|nr:ornithine cyclodeaminase family protein [Synergistales bacterium]